ncbi:ParB/Srx family N-terminal domain-containing protein [uncultured Parasutterella sp.]|uniref:ParB/Srx family N-terminal domain-containing protein n=1 Tax=uncultured Parasutterella sp. TaxID=1263098 RepID=UPI00258D6B69|nr:ParB/Srx family N-terminal domain-containing protein [uncultured Parasutterella sp.]
MDSHEQKLKIVYRQVEDLIPYEKNSRTHSEEQIQKVVVSIKEFGWTNPILIDEEQGIIAGHGRLEAAKRLGMKEVPVIELTGLTEAQKRAYIIADNKLALEAGWDEDLLREELDWLTQHDYSAEVTGFDSEDLQSLLSVNLEAAVEESESIEEPEGQAEDTQQNVPEIQDAEIIPTPPAPKSRPKDLWILGTHRLMCGDSTNEADIARLMGGVEQAST